MALNELGPEPARPMSATATEVHTGPATDPLAWFATTPHTDERWYWEIPEDGTAWVGMGSAATISTSGPGRFDEAAREADQLLDGLRVTGPSDAPLPRLAAGFAFDDTAQSGPWAPFGDGRLVLPAVQVLRRGAHTWVIRIDGHDRPTPVVVAPDPAGPVEVDAADWADVARLLATLRSTYPACATLGVSIGATSFVAATPERLVAVTGDRLRTAALAGSAPPHADPAIDAALGQGPLTSPKERSEHAVVVDAIDRSLQRLGIVDRHPADPTLLRLHGIQHLHTPIDAVLPTGIGLFDVVGALHPTPAVAGHPGGRSAELRSIHEGMERGWFASPVGWLDSSGDGEFRVALRSALVTDVDTTLYAGAGVVRGSDPSRELLETDVKLRALLGPVIATSETP